jgi:hypothetical protein
MGFSTRSGLEQESLLVVSTVGTDRYLRNPHKMGVRHVPAGYKYLSRRTEG